VKKSELVLNKSEILIFDEWYQGLEWLFNESQSLQHLFWKLNRFFIREKTSNKKLENCYLKYLKNIFGKNQEILSDFKQHKTVEFKLSLNKKQQKIIDSWLDDLQWVWNKGLELLLEYHHFKYYDWLFKELDKQDISKEKIRKCYLKFSKKSAFSATCQIATRDENFCSPSNLNLEKPRLKSDNHLGLSGYITKTRYAEIPQVKRLPSAFIKGTLKHLADAWSPYKNKKLTNRYKPKFKSQKRDDRLDTLYTLQPETITLESNRVKCPASQQLGKLKVVNKGLLKRWKKEVNPRTLKICRRPSGYYLQLTGEFVKSQVKNSDKACGLDVGLEYIYYDDAEHCVNPPKYYRQAQKKLAKLQRQINSKQEKRTLLFIQSATPEQITEKIPNFGIKTAESLVAAQPKTWKVLIQELLGEYPQPITKEKLGELTVKANHKATKLKFQLTPTSQREKKLQKRLAKQHEKIKLQRRNFNHKLSTYRIRTYGGIAVEDISISNLNKRPKVRKSADGKGYERNNSQAKSGLNKSFADAALGQLLTMIEQKSANVLDENLEAREFVKVKPHYTSQDCPECGFRQKKSLSQRTHRCQKCGYTTARDHAAAENIKAKADFVRSYRTCVRKVTPVEPDKEQVVKQELTSSEVRHRGVAPTTLKTLPRESNICADQELFEKSSLKKQAQTLSRKASEPPLDEQSIVANPESLTQSDVESKKRATQNDQNSISESNSRRSSQFDDSVQLELDLWSQQ